jgi:hypothetical protein
MQHQLKAAHNIQVLCDVVNQPYFTAQQQHTMQA